MPLPDSVKTVGEWAFYQCEGFTGLKLPAGLTKIEKLSFAFMAGLKTEVAIPEGVTEIGEGAFECSYMPSVRLPSTLKKIEKQRGISLIADGVFDLIVTLAFSKRIRTAREKLRIYANGPIIDSEKVDD